MRRRILTDDIPEMTARDFARAIDFRVHRRIMAGRIERGSDVADLRRFVGFGSSKVKFARALGVCVAVLRDWESGATTPKGPALVLLRLIAWHPRIVRSNLAAASRGKTRRPARASNSRRRD